MKYIYTDDYLITARIIKSSQVMIKNGNWKISYIIKINTDIEKNLLIFFFSRKGNPISVKISVS